MTEAIREKASARRVLAVLVGLLVTVLALQGIASVKPGGFEAFAQATASPTGPTIQFINPSEGTSLEISDKPEAGTTNGTYHLVAAASNVPAGATAEFKYQKGTNPEIRIGTATLVGADTFEFFWDVEANNPGEGAFNLKVILFGSNGLEIARDSETAVMNNTTPATPSPSDEPQAETVELTYPTNGGAFGYYVASSGGRSSVIDVVTSADATFVEVFYTLSAPGTEPQFKSCGVESKADAGDGVRCTFASGDNPANVTAVAARGDDTPSGFGSPDPAGAFSETSDAHRVAPYSQDPATVTIAPQTQLVSANATGDFPCSGILTATVRDSAGRSIAGVNVDVHASGPVDELFFDDSDSTGNKSSAHQAPDQGNHTSEAGVNCESADVPPPFTSSTQQGEHEVAGPGDWKHIESVAGGTDDAGGFDFLLNNRMRTSGGTQITAWADEDGNDLLCTQEAQGDASIGWGTAAPAVEGLPDQQSSCPKPTPGATATATATATSTSTTTQGPGTDRTVTLTADKEKMPAGRKVTFSGRIRSDDLSCTNDEFVQIRRRIHGETEFKDLFGTQTDQQGNFSVERRARKGADYIAIAPGHDNCAEDTSGEVTVLVKVLIQILPSNKTPDRGDTIRIKSSVRPQHDGTRLILQRKKGGGWVKVKATKMNNRSIGNFWVKARWNQRTFRTVWRKQHEDHISNRSRAVTIKTQ